VQREGGQWQYNPQHDSIITAGNGSSKPTQVAFTIFYNQGTQRYELDQTLQAGEQMWMDIGKLIRESIPDKNGGTLPADLTSGSYEIRDLGNPILGTLFEGKIIYDKTYGHVTYGCNQCCGYDPNNTILWYDPIGVPFQGTASDGVFSWYPCESQYNDVSSSFYNNWSSDNTPVVTVDYYGTHTGVAVGSADTQTFGNLPNNDIRLNCPLIRPSPGGGANTVPVINSIDPNTVLVGSNNVQLEIDGAGFGSSPPTVNLPAGVSSTGQQSSSDTKILITVNVSINATISPNSITVTNTITNLTSNKSSFTLDGPFNMVVQSDTMGLCNGCSTTVKRNVKYKIMNLSGSSAGAIPIGESYTPVSGWNCTQSRPSVSLTLCSAGDTANSDGTFTDGWSLASDGFTPAGCGETGNNVDEWQWCATSPATPVGKLTGWVKTSTVSINNYVNPPSAMPAGTVINP
jgi:hypothetical protein